MTYHNQDVTVIIPSLDPDDRLLTVVENVRKRGFTDIVLVNDGSATENLHYFEEAADRFGCAVLHHPENLGKGRALKTAFQWYLENRRSSLGCVTIDGDDQHHPDDIEACVNRMREDTDNSMILGVRDFDAENVPPKSRFGNRCTSFVFRTFCGLKVSDTQTGLRVFPNAIIPLMCEIDGERFEYETNMLLVCKNKKIPLVEQKIRTIYIDDNSSTHFRPIRDSLRVYGVIIRFFCSSILSFLIDNGIFNLMYALLKKQIGADPAVTAATVIARVISSLFNYTMNRKAVFKSDAPIRSTVFRYYILCAVQMMVSAGLVMLLSKLLGSGSFLVALIKIIVDTLLYFVSFRIQQNWVFRKQ
ncbi:MAG: bifunctional glycosyltransferase family 2/GtrA family protein [Oscillospiraceae bacterium]|nr:glycosyltransferase [Ruminococcus sp.]MBQ4346010.1 bifunctional glycosyltransferase family 2/GtrA family protein [Oscillospiraceae bacterium]